MASIAGRILRITPHRRIAELWADALQREGILAGVAATPDPAGGWALVAPEEQADLGAEVLREIDAQSIDDSSHDSSRDEDEAEDAAEDEDEEFPKPPLVSVPGWGKSWAGAVIAWLILAFHAISSEGHAIDWIGRGAADASRLATEPWRFVTALTLHADFWHAFSNAVWMVVFLTPVAWRIGPGASVLVVLAAGTLGNVMTGWVYGAGHLSIGASTAAFGALGLLAALTAMDPARRRRSWVVIAASAALLGFLGTSEHTDVLAHLTGWAFGVALGIPAAMFWREPAGKRAQAAMAGAALVIVVAAWILAFA